MLIRLLMILLIAATLPAPLHAQAPENPFSNAGEGATQPNNVPPQNPGGAPPPKPDSKPDLLLRMTKKDCEKVLRRRNVVGADYVAGVDVRGNSVTGADLKGTLSAADVLPEEIAFELSLNPLTFAGNEALEERFSNSSSGFGMVRFNLSSGALTLDGKRLNAETEQELAEICRQALGQ